MMTDVRPVKKVLKSQPTLEGAGVRLKRAFTYQQAPELDPFLLLDNFGSDNPRDYEKGFPWHPHRGIETITYMLNGEVEHADSMGNRGVIAPGDVQWMTAGSGIIHQEMPRGKQDGRMWGFQLWANLPAAQKMMDPRYRDVRRDQIPEITLRRGGVRVKVISGEVDGIRGPVRDIVIDPEYLDVTVPPGVTFDRRVKAGYTVCAYVIVGAGTFEPNGQTIAADNLVVYGDGDELSLRVYRTFAGMRCLVTNQVFEPGRPDAAAILQALGSDPLYVRLCQAQECFRARLTPKPWRCGVAQPPSRFPFDNLSVELRYRHWELQYGAVCASYAACRFVKQFGRDEVHPDVGPVLTLHDQTAGVDQNLRLA
jgi:quercetin 2,3-dioxygenase